MDTISTSQKEKNNENFAENNDISPFATNSQMSNLGNLVNLSSYKEIKNSDNVDMG